MYSFVKHILLISLLAFYGACSPDLGYETEMRAGLISVDSLNAPGIDKEIEAVISPYRSQLEEQMNEVLAYSRSTLTNSRSESPLGNYLADILMEWALLNETDYHIADFSLLNSGGIRSSWPEGEIKLYDVYKTMPFDNTVAYVWMNNSSLQKLVNYIAERQNMVIGNAIISGKPEDASIEIGGSPADQEMTYVLVTSDYLARGGDYMVFFIEAEKIVITDVYIRDVIADYLRKQEQAIEKNYVNRINISK